MGVSPKQRSLVQNVLSAITVADSKVVRLEKRQQAAQVGALNLSSHA